MHMQLTERRSSRQCNNVLVTDGDGRKAHLLLVFYTHIDVCWIRKIADDLIQDVTRGEGCSDEYQQEPH